MNKRNLGYKDYIRKDRSNLSACLIFLQKSTKEIVIVTSNIHGFFPV